MKKRLGSSRSIDLDWLKCQRPEWAERHVANRRHQVIDEAMVRLRQILIDNPDKLYAIKFSEFRHDRQLADRPQMQIAAEIEVMELEERRNLDHFSPPLEYRPTPPIPAWKVQLRRAGAWIRKHWQEFGHV